MKRTLEWQLRGRPKSEIKSVVALANDLEEVLERVMNGWKVEVAWHSGEKGEEVVWKIGAIREEAHTARTRGLDDTRRHCEDELAKMEITISIGPWPPFAGAYKHKRIQVFEGPISIRPW